MSSVPSQPVSPVSINNQIMPAPAPVLTSLATTDVQAAMSMELNREDVSAVLIDTAQQGIRGRISQHQESIKALEKAIRDETTLQDRYLEDWTGHAVRANAPLSTFLAAVGAYIRRDIVPTFGTASYNEKTRLIHSSLSVNVDNRFNFQEDFRGEPSADYLNSRNKLRDLNAELKVLQRDLLNARAALNNTDALRTQASSIMAQSIAGRSESGQKMLDQLRANLDVTKLINSLT